MLVLPAPVCLAADTSPLDGFRALVRFLSWFANRPAVATPRSFSACCRTASDSDVLRLTKANNSAPCFTSRPPVAIEVAKDQVMVLGCPRVLDHMPFPRDIGVVVRVRILPPPYFVAFPIASRHDVEIPVSIHVIERGSGLNGKGIFSIKYLLQPVVVRLYHTIDGPAPRLVITKSFNPSLSMSQTRAPVC